MRKNRFATERTAVARNGNADWQIVYLANNHGIQSFRLIQYPQSDQGARHQPTCQPTYLPREVDGPSIA